MMDSNYHADYVGFSHPDSDKSVLKDVTGRYRTNLFAEFNKNNQEDYPPLYTMREEPWKGLPSAYQIYMYSDSEYEAALKLVGSWQHWQRLLSCKPFMEGKKDGMSWQGLLAWREEKEIRDKAQAYNMLKTSAAQGNVQAQKLIYDGDKPAKRGRPTKAEVTREAKAQAETSQEIKNDLKRISLAVDNG